MRSVLSFCVLNQQMYFQSQSPGIPHKVAAYANDAMTGDDDWNRIFIIRAAYRSNRFR